MNDLLIQALMPREARWRYDDPSGVGDEPMRPRPDAAAPRRGRRLRDLAGAPVRPITPKEA
jgi:hypothetical protein